MRCAAVEAAARAAVPPRHIPPGRSRNFSAPAGPPAACPARTHDQNPSYMHFSIACSMCRCLQRPNLGMLALLHQCADRNIINDPPGQGSPNLPHAILLIASARKNQSSARKPKEAYLGAAPCWIVYSQSPTRWDATRASYTPASSALASMPARNSRWGSWEDFLNRELWSERSCQHAGHASLSVGLGLGGSTARAG